MGPGNLQRAGLRPRRLACLGLIAAISLLLAPGPLAAQVPDAGSLRRAAEAALDLGLRRGDPDLLLAGISGLLAGGVSPAADDPWPLDRAMAALRALPGTEDHQAILGRRITAAGRGVLAGPNRHDMALPPGERAEFALTMAAGEPAIIEARLKAGPAGADVDLLVTAPDGAPIASDAGPQSGVQGHGAYVEWWPDTCIQVTVTLHNAGDEVAQVVLLAPPARTDGCHAP